MLLTDRDILALQEQGTPLIAPFSEENLRGVSYDVRLDNEITPLQERTDVIDLSKQESLDSLYYAQMPADGFVLKPAQYCLAALAEEIALPDDVVAYVFPRTRYTRMGLLVANQFCNPSYSGRLRIGLFNASGNNLRLASYMPIAQLVFERLESAPSDERLYRNQKTAAYYRERDFMGARLEEEMLSDESRMRYDLLLRELQGEQL